MKNVSIKTFRTLIAKMLKQLPDSAGLLKKELIILSGEFDGFKITVNEQGLPAFGAEIAALDEITADKILNISRGYSPMDTETFLWQTKYVIIFTYLSDMNETRCFEKLGMLEELDCREISQECNPLHKYYETNGVYASSTEDTRARYRKKAAEIYAKTGDFPEFDNIGTIHATLFPPPGQIEYFAKLVLFTLLAVAGVFAVMIVYDNTLLNVENTNIRTIIIGTLLSIIPLYCIVKPFVDANFGKRTHSEPPPRLDIKSLPDDTGVLCVLSTLINSENDIKNGLTKLKTALNKNPGAKACLLCDLKPAKAAVIDKDRDIITLAQKLFENERDICVIIREREYSETQRMYQGRERKRGAVDMLCRALRDRYILNATRLLSGDIKCLNDIKFIVTLDYDTMPLMNSVTELAATALHPHNNAGIYVPRVTTTLESARKTAFSTIMAGESGTSGTAAYDSVAGEFYNDCFGAGTFTGKGLIDVDHFLESVHLPDERVLSHDILEGALIRGGTMFCGDIEFTDSFPPTSTGYFKRLNRWTRGDFQNIGFIFDNRMEQVNKFKLFDNVIKGGAPFLTLALAVFGFAAHSAMLSAIAVISVVSTFIPSILYELTNRGTKLLQCVINVLIMPFTALASLDAVVRTTVRTITKRRLLEWQTASVFDTSHNGIGAYVPTFIFSLIPTFIYVYFMGTSVQHFVLCLLWLSSTFVIFACDHRTNCNKKPAVSDTQKNRLHKNASQIWNFYTDYVTAEHNHLPPDNVQYSPVYRVAARTSPTNIGMYLLSIPAARKLGLVDTLKMCELVNLTITTVEKLKKWNGNLLNWYDTRTLAPISDFVSSVDSGNFLCCLVALKEALKEAHRDTPEGRGTASRGKNPGLCGKTTSNTEKDLLSQNEIPVNPALSRIEIESIQKLIVRISAIETQTDIKPLYNKAKKLFSIGCETDKKTLSRHNYDTIMSEARLLSYYAIGTSAVDKAHWRSLLKLTGKVRRHGHNVIGCMSWTGTMFEYFMPELLLSSKNGSLTYHALKYQTACQSRYAEANNAPFGISESAYYAFDDELNYQYKAHGAPAAALADGMEKNYVASPYSCFLSSQYDIEPAARSLAYLEKIGAVHPRYGFYEAVDFTPSRVGTTQNGDTAAYAIIKSHMSHHIGMSLLAITNVICEKWCNRMFENDERMNKCTELLEEKPISFSNHITQDTQKKKHESTRTTTTVCYRNSDIFEPSAHILSNGALTLMSSETGLHRAIYRNSRNQPVTLFHETRDVLNPRGIFSGFVDENGFAMSFDDYFTDIGNKEVSFSQNEISVLIKGDSLRSYENTFIRSESNTIYKKYKITNESRENRHTTIAVYIEPALAPSRDISAHPAYADLFVKVKYDQKNDLFIAERPGIAAMAVGFITAEQCAFSFDREEVRTRNGGIYSTARERGSNTKSVPCPCIFIKADLTIGAKATLERILFICSADDKHSVIEQANNIRANTAPVPETFTISPIVQDSLYGRLAGRVLTRLYIRPETNNTLLSDSAGGREPLWRHGISGDLPIVIFEFWKDRKTSEAMAAGAFIEMKKALQLCCIKYDLCIIYDNDEQLKLCTNIQNEINVNLYLLHRNTDTTAIYAAAACVINRTTFDVPRKTRPRKYFKITRVTPAEPPAVKGAKQEQIVISAADTPDLPWCNILANPAFGTLVSDRSLGYSWALNSRENKLTPWDNNLRRDNKGELVIIRIKENDVTRYYDAADGATAVFSPNKAQWYSNIGNISVSVTVAVPRRGMCKKITVCLSNKTGADVILDTAYYTEPIVGVDRYEHTKISTYENFAVCSNPFGAYKGVATITSDQKCRIITDRAAFWAGEWDNADNGYTEIAALIHKLTLPSDSSRTMVFYLNFTKDTINYERMYNATKSLTEIQHCDTFIEWQALCRVWARTGFYQCSGAYGFRDQLQDSLALSRQIKIQQICRCCAAQFPEGDVLHWWHDFGNVKKGVRTRYCDDLMWLPYAVADYVTTENDVALLSRSVCCCEGERLASGEHEKYIEARASVYKYSVYEHAKLSLETAYKVSSSGLLLMGGGDWCDGYNHVGRNGFGSSVWFTLFYIRTAKDFISIAKRHGDPDFADTLKNRAAQLSAAVCDTAWRGDRFMRAYYDDGTEMGVADNEYCKIDLLPQAWASISCVWECTDEHTKNERFARVKTALCTAEKLLVDRQSRIIKLFDPAFEGDDGRTGYVTKYPAGIRENGGQYTHGAIWLAYAFMNVGMYEKARQYYDMLSPENRDPAVYKVEPYYLAADIYTNKAAYGRGGWTIYTGSAGWYERLGRILSQYEKRTDTAREAG